MRARQLPLMDVPHARHTDPPTSKRAARSVSDESISETQGKILWAFKVCGDMTDHELLERKGQLGLGSISPSGIRTRRRELVDAGKLRDTGETRPTDSGRASIVWGLA